ncbi:hypothetical protein ACWOFR_12915 [Carnobacterium gallinarum]|uniref:hypothetical protein n=1 Tax=Carnobacterium gallinarum TaxID=2749 RepID=UPI0005574CF1|nr:hypothetical protein [Carnobacterium gallinarum]
MNSILFTIILCGLSIVVLILTIRKKEKNNTLSPMKDTHSKEQSAKQSELQRKKYLATIQEHTQESKDKKTTIQQEQMNQKIAQSISNAGLIPIIKLLSVLEIVRNEKGTQQQKNEKSP